MKEPLSAISDLETYEREQRRSEGEWEHPVKVAQFGKKIILQAAKMDFSDDGGVEKKTKQEGKQRKKRFYAACICIVI